MHPRPATWRSPRLVDPGSAPALGGSRPLVELRSGQVVEPPASGLPAPVARPPLSAVPDILAPGLRAVFCGINPGRASAAAGAHFANPRNDFWRLLADAGLTPRQLAPEEQSRLLEHGYGLTNAARRTTRGSSELRRGDFAGAAERLAWIAEELRPLVIAFVGKAAYAGPFRERPEHGLQQRRLDESLLFVLPSTSPANAAVSYEERLRWFVALRELLFPPLRRAARALVLDERDRVLLYRLRSPGGSEFWHAPGGGLEGNESWEEGLRRELLEEVGVVPAGAPQLVWTRRHVFVWHRVVDQLERYYLVRLPAEEIRPELIEEEGMVGYRWWAAEEIEGSTETFAPRRLARLLRDLLEHGPPSRPVEVGA